MNIPSTIRSWARSTDARIHVTRFKQDHTLDIRYPDIVPTVHLELTLDAGKSGHRPQLRIWIPLARRTPLFVFGPDASRPSEVDLEATFPTFETRDELVESLERIHADFLARYQGATRDN